MTPTWLKTHASYIDSSHTLTDQQLTFNAGEVSLAALLKVPMIPAGVLKVGSPLAVDITVAHDTDIGNEADSDIRYGVSDGTKFIGFQTIDKLNYWNTAPCYGTEGLSGVTLKGRLKSARSPQTERICLPWAVCLHPQIG